MRAVALQRLMGHKSIEITLDTYTSVFNKYKQSEINKVNEYYLNNGLVSKNLLDITNDYINDTKDTGLER